MDYYTLKLCGLTRQLPIVSLGPKLKIASFNLLGDGGLVEKTAEELAKELKKLSFDCLVGPEVKVVPLIQVLSRRLSRPRYVILRKNIKGYMVRPVTTQSKPGLVLDGSDADFLKGKKVVIVDDVISTGRTIRVVGELMRAVGAEVVKTVAVLKQGGLEVEIKEPFFSLQTLPVFGS